MCPFALWNCRLPEKISNGNKNDRLLLTSTLIFFFAARFSLNVKNKNIATALKEPYFRLIYNNYSDYCLHGNIST